jgi:hypothetical protein
VNLLGDNIDTIKKNTETLIGATKEVGLEVNAEKTKSCFCRFVVQFQRQNIALFICRVCCDLPRVLHIIYVSTFERMMPVVT